MLVDLLFDPFGARWNDVRAGALAAEEVGFDGIWLYDHLAGSVHGQARVLECWTVLAALAAVVPRVSLGPMVLNVANRDAGTLAVMAATFQEVSNGRLLLGLGAGGGANTAYATEQWALGRDVGDDATRRTALEHTVARVRSVWANDTVGASGFLLPRPTPPVIVGGFGPKMAELAGRVGDGLNTNANSQLMSLVQIARDAHERSGRDPAGFIVTASSAPTPSDHDRLKALGVDRMVVLVAPPYVDDVGRLAAMLGR